MTEKELVLENVSVVLGLIELSNQINKFIKKTIDSNPDPSASVTQETLNEIQTIIQEGTTMILTPINLESPEGLIKLLNMMKGR